MWGSGIHFILPWNITRAVCKSLSDLVLIFLSACLVNNLVLDHLIGVAPAVELSRRMDVALVTGGASLAVAALAAPVAWLLHAGLLAPLGLKHFGLLALAGAVSAIVMSGAAVFQRRKPRYAAHAQAFVPLLLGNSTALGVALLAVERAHGPLQAFAFGLGAGTGFVVVLALLAALADRSTGADVPRALRGAPVMLLTLAILSMAFMGFSGLTGL